MIEKVRKLAVKIENNSDKIEIGMAIALLVVVILSVIPLYVFGYYTVPVADDYNMILKTHSAWESSHSIWQVFTAALATAKEYYMTWSGAFFNMFLQSLLPGLGDYSTYFLSSWILITIYLAAAYYFWNCVIIHLLKGNRWQWLIVASVTVVIQIQAVPSLYDMFYWYVGAVGYGLAYSMKMVLLGMMIKQLAKQNTCTKWYFIYSVICAFLIGGMEFGPTSMVFVIVSAFMICYSVYKKRQRLYIVSVSAAYYAAWIIAVIAPGNSVRQEQVGQRNSAVFAILQALKLGAQRMSSSLSSFLLILTLLILPAVIITVKNCNLKFKHPFIFAFLSYGICSSMYTPIIYANYGQLGIINVYTYNVIYYAFIVFWILNIIYMTGWVVKCLIPEISGRGIGRGKHYRPYYYGAVVALLCLDVLVAHNIGSYASGYVLQTLHGGECKSGKEYFLQREEILRNSQGQDVVVNAIYVPLNTSDSSDVTTDPNNWVNKAVAQYYHLNSIVRE